MSVEVGSVCAIGILFIGVGLYYYFSKKPVTIYNQSTPPIKESLINVKQYNHTVGKLTICYGLCFIIEGLCFYNDPLICFVTGILTIMPGIVIFCYLYERILEKYRK